MPNQEQLKPISWRKTAGTFTLRRSNGQEQVIGPGEIFQALPEEIPMAFRDTIIPVDSVELAMRNNPPLDVVDPGYKVVAGGKVPGRYNVVNSRGKVMNEKLLAADEAAKLVKVLTAG